MKTKTNKLWPAAFLLTFFLLPIAMAGESLIPLKKGLRIASDDLIYNGRVLSSRDADALGKDLSKLNPQPNDIWDDSQIAPFDDQQKIAINSEDVLSYEGALASNSGLYRFNAIPLNGNKIYTIHLDKSLHTMLLRKNLLRQLGYKIPAMKYLQKVVIQFSSKVAMDSFLTREIPEATLGAASRWTVVDLVQANQLSVTLKDVAVTEPDESDFYNVSMGVPTQTINSRSLRSLVIPYSLVDLYESVNKFSWIDGKIDNQAVILGHFTGNQFATTVDDALWMVEKINKLTRDDFKKIVSDAFFPAEVGAILVEKLISRRNSLSRLFSVKAPELDFDAKISIASKVEEGKLLQKEYPDYASRFAYGDAESPFDQLRYFLYSKVQSTVIDNVISTLNKELSVYEINDARLEYFQKQFKEGLDHFVKTGELRPIGVGTWVSPIVNGNLIFSRDIVLGNYLGTDNLVQLADTVGASADLGVFVGIEGLGNNLASSVKVGVSMVRTYTHLKPVKNLRESLKEPYRNMFVNLMKKSLKEKYFSLSELQKADGGDPANEESVKTAKEAQSKKIQEVLAEIDKNLDVGESLIITDRVIPSANVRLNFTDGILSAGVGVATGAAVIKRIHLYKKSPKVLQIYDDAGLLKSIDLSFHVSSYITILRVNTKVDKGSYNIKSYMVNLSSDISENPNLFSNALGVYNVLANKNFELLDVNNPPVKVDVKFKDRTTGLSLLFWKAKFLTGKTYYDFSAKNGVQGSYYTLQKDFLTGINPTAFVKQVANYYIAREFEKLNISLAEEGDKNPGETPYGRSQTQKIRFEAALDENKKFTQKFISLSDEKQGWSIGEKKMKKFMGSINEKFQTKLFEPDQVDFEKLRFYKVGYHMNLYNRGIERLHTISIGDIIALENKYIKRDKSSIACAMEHPNIKLFSRKCGSLNWVKNVMSDCPKSKNEEEMSECTVKLFDQVADDIDFNDLKKLLGEENIYVYGSIDGFREKSEILNDTIYSNTIGKIGSKQWDGPMAVVRDLLGLSQGESNGSWLRGGL